MKTHPPPRLIEPLDAGWSPFAAASHTTGTTIINVNWWAVKACQSNLTQSENQKHNGRCSAWRETVIEDGR